MIRESISVTASAAVVGAAVLLIHMKALFAEAPPVELAMLSEVDGPQVLIFDDGAGAVPARLADIDVAEQPTPSDAASPAKLSALAVSGDRDRVLAPVGVEGSLGSMKPGASNKRPQPVRAQAAASSALEALPRESVTAVSPSAALSPAPQVTSETARVGERPTIMSRTLAEALPTVSLGEQAEAVSAETEMAASAAPAPLRAARVDIGAEAKRAVRSPHQAAGAAQIPPTPAVSVTADRVARREMRTARSAPRRDGVSAATEPPLARVEGVPKRGAATVLPSDGRSRLVPAAEAAVAASGVAPQRRLPAAVPVVSVPASGADVARDVSASDGAAPPVALAKRRSASTAELDIRRDIAAAVPAISSIRADAAPARQPVAAEVDAPKLTMMDEAATLHASESATFGHHGAPGDAVAASDSRVVMASLRDDVVMPRTQVRPNRVAAASKKAPAPTPAAGSPGPVAAAPEERIRRQTSVAASRDGATRAALAVPGRTVKAADEVIHAADLAGVSAATRSAASRRAKKGMLAAAEARFPQEARAAGARKTPGPPRRLMVEAVSAQPEATMPLPANDDVAVAALSPAATAPVQKERAPAAVTAASRVPQFSPVMSAPRQVAAINGAAAVPSPRRVVGRPSPLPAELGGAMSTPPTVPPIPARDAVALTATLNEEPAPVSLAALAAPAPLSPLSVQPAARLGRATPPSLLDTDGAPAITSLSLREDDLSDIGPNFAHFALPEVDVVITVSDLSLYKGLRSLWSATPTSQVPYRPTFPDGYVFSGRLAPKSSNGFYLLVLRDGDAAASVSLTFEVEDDGLARREIRETVDQVACSTFFGSASLPCARYRQGLPVAVDAPQPRPRPVLSSEVATERQGAQAPTGG